MHGQPQLYSSLATLIVLALIVRRTLRTQTVRVWTLVAIPVLLIVVAGLAVAVTPPQSALGVLIIVAGALAGAGLGYARGRHSQVQLGQRTGTLVVQGNVVLVAVLVAAFAVRFVVRATLGPSGPLSLALSDAFIVLAAASVAIARGMLYLTWRRLIGSGQPRLS